MLISTIALMVLLVAQSMCLLMIFKECMRLRSMRAGTVKQADLAWSGQPEISLESEVVDVGHVQLLGKSIPKINARILDSKSHVTERDFIGTTSSVFFIGSAQLDEVDPEVLALSINYLWNKADGKVFIVCGGTDKESRSLDANSELTSRYGSSLTIIGDEDGQITRSFGIDKTPIAILVDEEGRISRVGESASMYRSETSGGIRHEA